MPPVLNQVVPWGRGFAEYERMFALTPADLERPILGCADGPASFNAEATACGARVVSCDPVYQIPAEAIASRIAAAHPTILADLEANRHAYVWSEFSSPADVAASRLAAMERFMTHYLAHGEPRDGYVAGALPGLPFRDGSFGLALCSHFLFLYSPDLPLAFHIAAMFELCRVSEEVRVFPLVDRHGNVSAFVDPVERALGDSGCRVDRVTVPYEFQRGGNVMLRARARAV